MSAAVTADAQAEARVAFAADLHVAGQDDGPAAGVAQAEDVVAICRELGLTDVVLVGHSVSAMIGVLAVRQARELFGALVMIGPNPRYVDDGDYTGGFSRADVAALLDSLDANHLGWSAAMAPVIMGNPERPELTEELTNSFCRTDPARLFTLLQSTTMMVAAKTLANFLR